MAAPADRLGWKRPGWMKRPGRPAGPAVDPATPYGPGPAPEPPRPDPFRVTNAPVPPPRGTAIPREQSFAALWQSINRTFYSRGFDEALKHSYVESLAVRRDLLIHELLRHRQLPTVSLPWHLEPDDPKDEEQAKTTKILTRIMETTPRLRQMFLNLLEAVYYGKYGSQVTWGHDRVDGKRRVVVKRHQPLNGDKIIYRWDEAGGDPGVLVYAGYTPDGANIIHSDRGRLLVLDTPYWRDRFIIHTFEPTDTDFMYESEMGMATHGLGLRSRLWFYWFMRKEILGWGLDALQRMGTNGMLYGFYPTGDGPARDALIQALVDLSRDNIAAFPVDEVKGDNLDSIINRIEPSSQGYEVVKLFIDYLDDCMRKAVLGQSLTSTAEATGMGSKVAEAHESTFDHIIRYDATSLAETITEDLIRPLIRFNLTADLGYNVHFKFKIDKADSSERGAAYTQAFQMNIPFDREAFYEDMGITPPESEDSAVQQQPPMMPGAEGQPGAGGVPPGAEDMMAAAMGGAPPEGGPPGAGGAPPAEAAVSGPVREAMANVPPPAVGQYQSDLERVRYADGSPDRESPLRGPAPPRPAITPKAPARGDDLTLKGRPAQETPAPAPEPQDLQAGLDARRRREGVYREPGQTPPPSPAPAGGPVPPQTPAEPESPVREAPAEPARVPPGRGPVDVASPGFKAWFGDWQADPARASKVVSPKTGKPRLVFHGTEEGEIGEFRPPAFFTESRSEAEAYAAQTDTAEDLTTRYEPVGDRKLPAKWDVMESWPDYRDYDGPPNEVVLNGNTGRLFYWNGKTNPVGDRDIVILSGVTVDDSDIGPHNQYAPTVYRPTEDDEAEEPRELDRRVHSVYLDIRNPIELPWQEANLLGRRLGATPESQDETLRKYRERGHDGILTASDDAAVFQARHVRQWIPFSPEQVWVVAAEDPDRGPDKGPDRTRYAAGPPATPAVPAIKAPAQPAVKSQAPQARALKTPKPPTETDPVTLAARDWKENRHRSRAFKAWFGEWEHDPANASKVVHPRTGEPQETHPIPGTGTHTQDEAGKPIVVYHGTAHGGFDAFDKEKQNPNSLYGPGFYFTEDRGIAESYQDKAPPPPAWKEPPDEAGRLVAARLRARLAAGPPLDLDTRDFLRDLSRTKPENITKYLDNNAIGRLRQAGVDLGDLVKAGGTKAVHAAHLNIRHPVRVDEPLTPEVAEQLGAGVRRLFEAGTWHSDRGTDVAARLRRLVTYYQHPPTVEQALSEISNDIATKTEQREVSDGMGGKKLVNSYHPLTRKNWPTLFQAAGFDGVTHIGGHITGGKKHRVWIAFEPHQVKSVDNRGTFDPQDHRIHYAATDTARYGKDRSADPGVMIGCFLPRELATELALDGGEDPDRLHLTLAYLGRKSEVGDKLPLVEAACRSLARHCGPLTGTVGGLGRFPASESSDGKDVLYANVDLPDLSALRERLVDVLETLGAPPRTDHGFTPHVTLLYLDPDADSPLDRLDRKPVEFGHLTLAVGDDRRDFPFGGNHA